MRKKYFKFLCFLGCMSFMVSCSSTKLTTTSVAYQSVTTKHAQPTQISPIPEEANIAVAYMISSDGNLTAVVYNRTSEIMIIDQTMSFFVNSNGTSTSYYDPTVRTTSTTNLSSTSKGASVNLGAVAGAFGIGGVVGQLANGINVGGSGTSGQTLTNTTYVADQPRISLSPRSNGAMSKVFNIAGIGKDALKQSIGIFPSLSEKESYCHFSVCISYSLDGGNTFDKIVTEFYADSKIVVHVANHGEVNEALRKVYTTKPDALNEPWWMLYFANNIDDLGNDSKVQGVLFDYQ